MRHLAIAILVTTLFSCAETKTSPTPSPDTREQANAMQKLDVTTSRDFADKHQTFSSYWNRGLAELTRFELEQSRYGELHTGEAVMIFVTEPFMEDTHVKYEGRGDRSQAVKVLKLNNYRRFYTGVYPYTLMTSTFTPAEKEGPTYKLTQSVQEWCGQVYSQLNVNDGGSGYDGVSYSYFQSGGDQKFDLPTTLIEDELYTRIRLGPEKLPTGEIELVPGVNFLRLKHKPWAVAKATASLSKPADTEFSDQPVRTYAVEYPDYDRTLKIYFEADFPHRIVGFEEISEAIFNPEGGDPEMLTTRGKLTDSIMLDYWTKNGTKDAVWQDALGLEH